ncbi:MAG: DUF378 domain-containing protein [Planctomycetes bacterium]|nr:DUF378 domain-containing protein [Planctomycetota bacterium]
MITLTKSLNVVTAVLLLIGGLNWGLIGLFNYNLVDAIFGNLTLFTRILYVIVGLSAIYEIVMFRTFSACWLYPRAVYVPRTAH